MHAHYIQTVLFQSSLDSLNIVFFFDIFKSFKLTVITNFSKYTMAMLEAQESAEYYKWLFQIERAEFENELLDIVSLIF